MKKIKDIVSLFFILCILILTTISILGVWDFVSDDVISKSVMTIGLLAVVSLIIIGATHFIGSKPKTNFEQQNEDALAESDQNSMVLSFNVIRHIVIGILILSAVILAFLGVLSIWDLMEGKVLGKSISSIGIIMFASSIITITCLSREGHKISGSSVSGWVIFAIIAGIWAISWFV